MPRIHLTEIVPHTPQQMFDLVIDIEHYPDFLPWCVRCRKSRQQPRQFVAEMTFSIKGISDTFYTLDKIDPGKKVEVNLISGPFNYLVNVWQFTPAPNGGTSIDFMIDFRFKSRLMDLTIGGIFAHASRQMISAFRKRASVVYSIS